MFDNVGGKIKTLATVSFAVETIVSIIAGIVLVCCGFVDYYVLIFIGIGAMLVGPVIALITNWFLYGFGELIEKTCEIAQNTCGNVNKTELRFEGVQFNNNNLKKTKFQSKDNKKGWGFAQKNHNEFWKPESQSKPNMRKNKHKDFYTQEIPEEDQIIIKID